MRDPDLRASLAAIGQLHPAWEYEGELIDGRRRAEICATLGLALQVRVCNSLREACSTLWTLGHQDRALELARREGLTSLLELAAVCGATPARVALLLQEAPSPQRRRDRVQKAVTALKRHEPRMVRRVVTFEPELLQLAKEKAKMTNKNLAMVVRDAVWRFVRDVSGAPRVQPRRVQPRFGARRRTG